jgi:DNA-directed RNA polymerase specialized sigma24 family protein
MISDGIENCLQYIYNFDPDKGKNPFAYFTQIIYYAFLRRIQKEKKYLYTKHVATELAEINGTTTENQTNDHTNYKNDTGHGEWTQEQMRRFMDDFETSKRKRRKTKVDNKS